GAQGGEGRGEGGGQARPGGGQAGGGGPGRHTGRGPRGADRGGVRGESRPGPRRACVVSVDRGREELVSAGLQVGRRRNTRVHQALVARRRWWCAGTAAIPRGAPSPSAAWLQPWPGREHRKEPRAGPPPARQSHVRVT